MNVLCPRGETELTARTAMALETARMLTDERGPP